MIAQRWRHIYEGDSVDGLARFPCRLGAADDRGSGAAGEASSFPVKSHPHACTLMALGTCRNMGSCDRWQKGLLGYPQWLLVSLRESSARKMHVWLAAQAA